MTVQKSNGNGYTRFIMAGIFGVLILASFSWTTLVFFNMNKKLDNHLFHVQASVDKVLGKVHNIGERLSNIEGRLNIKKSENNNRY